ncbi:MAG: alpha/beta fold hydrolase [Acidimicrobiales bacterium]
MSLSAEAGVVDARLRAATVNVKGRLVRIAWRCLAAVLTGTVLIVTAAGSVMTGASTTNTTTTVPRAFVPGPGARAGMVVISPNRKMYLECRGSGSPTVVLIPGLIAAADTWSYVTDAAGANRPSRTAVYPRVSTFTRVCSYDRPGTVRENGTFTPSTPVAQPTTLTSDAADLHALLTAARVTGPYVLVGWSFGGPIARFYASTYPHDVAGLVLVDGTSEYLQSALSPADFTVFLELAQRDDAQRVAQWKDVEQFDPAATFAQLRAAPAVPTMPVVVLSADKFDPDAFRARLPPGAPSNYPQLFWRAQLSSQDSLAKLFPGAIHIADTRSSHNIQNYQPQLVVKWVRYVVNKVRRNR